MIKAIFFDLDGTLLPMKNEDEFTKVYFKLLCQKFVSLGIDKDKFMTAVLDGLHHMENNDGTMTNEDAYWTAYEKFFENGKSEHVKIFKEFYLNEFKNVKVVCGENPFAREVIDNFKTKFKLVLSTNPLFPPEAIGTRLGFVGLKLQDFDYVSTYDNSSYSKLNSNYYTQILNKLNLKPEEVILFGNDVKKDAEFASKIGIHPCVIEDDLDDPEGKLENFDHIKFKDIVSYINARI